MKKKTIIIIAIIIFIIMLIPVPIRLKDGGSVEYKAILYKYTKIHRLNENSSTGYEDGWELKILGIRVGGATNVNVYVEAIPFAVVKNEIQDTNKFNPYVETSEKVIYLSSNIREIYYYVDGDKYILQKYLTNTYQTLDDALKHVTDEMDNVETFRDGGTKIYKSKKYDLTIIECNRLGGTKDVFIGDSQMEFDDSTMCK